MSIQRTVLLEYGIKPVGGEVGPLRFRVERWFLPVDQVVESVARPALIWDDGEERVVLLGPTQVRALISALEKFA